MSPFTEHPRPQAPSGGTRGVIERLLGFDDAALPVDIVFWQERIFRLIFVGAAFLGFGGYLLNTLIAYRSGHWLRIAAYTTAYAGIVCLAVARRPPYKVRAWAGMVLFYLLGIFSFVNFGPAGSGRMWLLASALLSSLLCGLSVGIKAMAVNVATFLVLGGLMLSGRLGTLLQPQIEPSVWFTSGLTFLFLCIVGSLGIGFFVDRLERVLEHDQGLLVELKQAVAKLREENRERRSAEDRLRSSERSLKQLAAELEARVSDRTQALEASNRQLRGLYRKLQQAREEERRLISREVHDDLGQDLTALRIDLAWLKKRCPAGEAGVHAKLESMTQVLDGTLKRLQRISAELRPGILDALGLCPAAEWLLKDFEKRTEIPCGLVCEPEEIVLDQARRTAAFRILQEALTNIARHARATRVAVALRLEDGCVHLEIVDNGVGISHEKANSFTAVGISGIRERAAEFGGETRIQGRPGLGTEIAVTLPAAPPERT